jgi:phosphonate transport system permease protein
MVQTNLWRIRSSARNGAHAVNNSGSNTKQLLFDAINLSLIVAIVTTWVAPPLETNSLTWLPTLGFSFLALALGLIFSLFINRKSPSLGRIIFASPRDEFPVKPLLKTIWGWQLLFSLLIVLIAAGQATEFSLRQLLDEQGLHAAANLFLSLLSPDWQLLPVAVFQVIETIFIALLATILALPIAFVLSFFAAKNIMKGRAAFICYALLRTFLNLIRSVEPIIWAVIFAVWVGVGPFAGMLALMIQSIASLTKQYSEIIESANDGPIDAILSTGARRVQVIWFGVVPQVVLPFISFTLYRWDINVRMATIIGFAGGGGIGTILYQYSMRAQWPQVGCLVLVIAAVVWLIDLGSAYLREALK